MCGGGSSEQYWRQQWDESRAPEGCPCSLASREARGVVGGGKDDGKDESCGDGKSSSSSIAAEQQLGALATAGGCELIRPFCIMLLY